MRDIGEVEIIISYFLRVGVIISSVVIILGLLLFLQTGYSGYPENTFPITMSDVISGLLAGKPYAIMTAGLIILMGIPVLRVALSIFAFFKEKDYLYVKITTGVFVILIISILMGKVG
ncbi:MAG: DUF1634 domain-containing protein [Pelosinus sp.]|nr:DUF1634 domain-containing protein [Pelosinus sp.]